MENGFGAIRDPDPESEEDPFKVKTDGIGSSAAKPELDGATEKDHRRGETREESPENGRRKPLTAFRAPETWVRLSLTPRAAGSTLMVCNSK